ncbi:MAG: PstS family phosphate ABC transporter substrate-binding protein [Desulfomonile sp.]|jgi:phosphate transport system substrate-binding protein
MKKCLAIALGMALLGATLITMSDAQTEGAKSVVRISGADSMFNRIRVLSKVFMNAHPAIQVDLVGGSLVDIGMQELIDNKADIAMASRSLTAKEDQEAVKKGVELVERLIGYGGIVIIVNPSNPVNELTVDQVKKIFKGEYTRWDQVGGRDQFITVVRQDDTQHPGTYLYMVDDFLGGPFADKSIALTTYPSIMNKVSTTPASIGFVRQRDAFESPIAKKAPIKVLKIKRTPALVGVMPSRETLADSSYALRRPYYLYYSTKAGADAVKFADFIVSKGWGSQDL